MYQYFAIVERWIDGDSVILFVDLGFGIWHRAHFRLHGVDTPERGEIHYTEAGNFCRALAPVGSYDAIQSFKPGEDLDEDKYGRWLCDAIPTPLKIVTADDVSISRQLIEAGLGVPYFGGTR